VLVSSVGILLKLFHDKQAYFTTVVSYTPKLVLQLNIPYQATRINYNCIQIIVLVSSVGIVLESVHDNQAYFSTIVSYTLKWFLKLNIPYQATRINYNCIQIIVLVSSVGILLESFHDNQAYFATAVSYTLKTVLEIEHTLPGYTHKLQS
jgi:hypothetical protein